MFTFDPASSTNTFGECVYCILYFYKWGPLIQNAQLNCENEKILKLSLLNNVDNNESCYGDDCTVAISLLTWIEQQNVWIPLIVLFVVIVITRKDSPSMGLKKFNDIIISHFLFFHSYLAMKAPGFWEWKFGVKCFSVRSLLMIWRAGSKESYFQELSQVFLCFFVCLVFWSNVFKKSILSR